MSENVAAGEVIFYDLISWLQMQREWSRLTFGSGARTEGLCKHIAKELDEIRAQPTDLSEWIDVAILAFDGAWRVGYTPTEIAGELRRKQAENMARVWPAPGPESEPVEHERETPEAIDKAMKEQTHADSTEA